MNTNPKHSEPCNTHSVDPTDGVATLAAWWCYDCDAPAHFDDVHVSELNGEEVERQGDEFVCLACRTLVMPAGHERWECEEAGRERAAESAADYRY